MAAKFLALLVVAVTLTQGHALTEITLADETRTHISNPLFGMGITIPKLFLDTLQTCHIVYPNGVMYQVYPTNQLPSGPVSFSEAVQPFTSCSVSFVNPAASFSGTYELMSLVQHSADNSLSLTRQRFHLSFIASELWNKKH